MPLGQIEVRGPFKGVNKLKDPAMLEAGEADDALNAILDGSGTIKKRPGWVPKIVENGTTKVLGIFDFQQNNGTRLPLIKKGLKLYKIPDLVPTEIGTDAFGSVSQIANFATVNNRCYFCDGSVFKVTDGSQVFSAAIDRPTGIPTAVVEPGDGNLKGVYDYKYTYFSGTWGQESFSSPASALVRCIDGQGRSRVTVASSGDGRVTAIRLYRRKVSAFEAIWTMVGDVPNLNGDVIDNLLDNDIDFRVVAPVSVTIGLPTFRFLTYQAGVLFAAGADDFPSRVYFSRANQPWILDDFEEVGSGGDNEPITGLAAFEGLVVVFKLRSIWVISGNSRDTFYVRKVKSDIGCTAHGTIVQVDNLLYFFSQNGWYVFDGNDTTEISGEIRPDILKDRNLNRDVNMVGVHDLENGAIWWSYSSGQSTANDKMYVFFYRNSRIVGGPSWVPWRMGDVSALGVITYTSSSGLVRRPVIGVDGVLATFEGQNDGVLPTQFFWRTGKIDAGIQDRKKIWRECFVKVAQQTTPSTLNVNYRLNGTAASSLLLSRDQSAEILRGYFKRSSKDIRLEFESLVAGEAEIRGFGLWAESAGRA